MAFNEIMDDEFSIKNLEDAKNKKSEFHWKNIMAIPHFLTKAYLSLEKLDPKSVAEAFYVAMKEFDLNSKNNMIDPNLIDEENIDNLDKTKISGEEEFSGTLDKENEDSVHVLCIQLHPRSPILPPLLPKENPPSDELGSFDPGGKSLVQIDICYSNTISYPSSQMS
jgi:hypothetical protein